MSAADWWGLAWALSGIPFAIVCTAQIRREDGSWLGLIAGPSIGLMFGPMSLLLIVRNCDDHPEHPRRDCPECHPNAEEESA